MFGFGKDDDKECRDGEYEAYHEGDFEPTDEKWKAEFIPEKQDDDYIYGYVRKEPYVKCQNCGKKVKGGSPVIDKEFRKVPKDDVDDVDIDELEMALGRLKVM